MQQHVQTIKHVADAAAGTTALATVWQQGPIFAAWASGLYFVIRGAVAILAWWRKRRGRCPACGEH